MGNAISDRDDKPILEALEPRLLLSAILEDTTWGNIGEPYEITDELVVANGATLTIESGVDVIFGSEMPFPGPDDARLLVQGGLDATNARFSAGEDSFGSAWIQFDDTSAVDIDGCEFSGLSLYLREGSLGHIRGSSIDGHVQVNPSSVLLDDNDLSNASLSLLGDSGLTVDLRNNWWGSIHIDDINDKVADYTDQDYRPLAILTPWSTESFLRDPLIEISVEYPPGMFPSYRPGDEATVLLKVHNYGDAIDGRITLNVIKGSSEWPQAPPFALEEFIYDSFLVEDDQWTQDGLGGRGLLVDGETEIYEFSFVLPDDAPLGEYRCVAAFRDTSIEFGLPEAILDTTGPDAGVNDWSLSAYAPAFTVGYIDQQAFLPNTHYGGSHNITILVPLGQEFVPSQSAHTGVDFSLMGSYPPASYTIRIREDTITGPIVPGSEMTLNPTGGAADGYAHFIHFEFPEPLELTPGDRYVIEANASWGIRAYGDVYTGGGAIRFGGPYEGMDWPFRTHVRPSLPDGTSYMVNSLAEDVVADDGVVTLREAIQAANTNTAVTSDVLGGSPITVDIITFDQAALQAEAGPGNPLTITLDGTQLEITDNMDIQGLGADVLSIDANGHSRAFYISGEGTEVELAGLTITGGSTTGAGHGGGIDNRGILTLTNTTVSGNSADTGGGIYSYSTLTMTNTTVSDNSAINNGGGIGNYGTLTLTNTMVSGNSAINAGGIGSSGTLTLTNTTVSGNSATDGGGIGNSGTLMLTNSMVSGNLADRRGGGIDNPNPLGTLTLTNTTVSGNSASKYVGGIYNSGTLTLTNSTVSGNSADSSCGGIFNAGTLTLTNSTVSDNSAGSLGGGIFNDGNLALTNSTISRNSARGGGGGIYLMSGGLGDLLVYNTIVARNFGGTAGIADDVNGTLDPDRSYNNLIGDMATSGGLTNDVNGNIVGVTDLNWLWPLADNGGPTQTHAIAIGSLPMDAGGNDAAITAGLLTDQRGYERFFGTDGIVDIGAVEVQTTAQPIELTPVSMVIPAYGIGQEIQIQLQVTNHGTEMIENGLVTLNIFPTGETWETSAPIYDSHDPFRRLPEDSLDYVLPPLWPGDSREILFHFELPGDVIIGQYYSVVAIVRGGAEFDRYTEDFDDIQYVLDDTSPGVGTFGLYETAYLPAFEVAEGVPEFEFWGRLTEGVVTVESLDQPGVILVDREHRVVVSYPKIAEMEFLELDIGYAQGYPTEVVTLCSSLSGMDITAIFPTGVLGPYSASVADTGSAYIATWTYQINSTSDWYDPSDDTSKLYFEARSVLSGGVKGPTGRPKVIGKKSWLTEGMRMEGAEDTYDDAIVYSTPFRMDSRDMADVIIEAFGETIIAGLSDLAAHVLATSAIPVIGPVLTAANILGTYAQAVGDLLTDPIVAVPFADGEILYGSYGLSATADATEYGIFVGVDLPRTYPYGVSTEYDDLTLLVWQDGWAAVAHDSRSLLAGDDLKELIQAATRNEFQIRSLLIAPKESAFFNAIEAPTPSVEVEANVSIRVEDGPSWAWRTLSDRTWVTTDNTAATASEIYDFEGVNEEWNEIEAYPASAELVEDPGGFHHYVLTTTNGFDKSEDAGIWRNVYIPSTANGLVFRYKVEEVGNTFSDSLQVVLTSESEEQRIPWSYPLESARDWTTTAPIDVSSYAGQTVELKIWISADKSLNDVSIVSIDDITYTTREVVHTDLDTTTVTGGTEGARAVAYDENGDGMPDRIEDPLSDFEAPVVSVEHTRSDIGITETKTTVSLEVPKESGWICFSTPLVFQGQRQLTEVRTTDGRVISPSNWWVSEEMLYVVDDPDTTYLLVYDQRYSATDTHTGSIDFNRSGYVGTASLATVIVADQDMDIAPGAFNDTLSVNIVSPSDPLGEVLVLDETMQPGIFSGEVGFELVITSENGLLCVAPDDEITATYLDVENSDGFPAEILTRALFTVASVEGRHIFYNNSIGDGNDPADGPSDDAAIAPDKTALLPGGTANPANYTSYSRGVNGIMIDVAGLGSAPTAGDFGVQINGAADPDIWSAGPVPTVSIRPGEGVGDSDRVTLIWADGAILNQWVEVTVRATANTALAADDVFYLSNLVGDCDGDGEVGSSDYGQFAGEFGRRGGIGAMAADLNGDGRVDLADLAIMRRAIGNSVLAPTILPTAAPGPVVESALDALAVPGLVTSVNPEKASYQSPETTKPLGKDATVIPSTALRASSNQLTADGDGNGMTAGIDLLMPSPSDSISGAPAISGGLSASALQRAATAAYDLRPLGDDPHAPSGSNGASDDPGDDLLADVLEEAALSAISSQLTASS